MNPVIIYFIIMIMLIIVGLAIYIVSAYLSKKRLEEVVTKLGLVNGAHYDVTTNNGNNHRDLIYDHIAYGKNSQNGKINIYFIKNSTYRGSATSKEIMIKYGNIWKINRVDSPTITVSKNSGSFTLQFNEEDEYREKLRRAQIYVRERYPSISAVEIYNKACEINTYARPCLESVTFLHYYLTEFIDSIYKLRDTDAQALDYCLKVCEMDIALYDDIRKASIKEMHDDLIYAGALSRKIIILEKRGEYQQAIEACDFAIANGYKNGAKDDGSNSFIKQRNRIQNKLAKLPVKNTISNPKQ